MILLGIYVVLIGIGLLMGNYQTKDRFIRRGDYTEKDIEDYQKVLVIGLIIIVIGLVMIF